MSLSPRQGPSRLIHGLPKHRVHAAASTISQLTTRPNSSGSAAPPSPPVTPVSRGLKRGISDVGKMDESAYSSPVGRKRQRVDPGLALPPPALSKSIKGPNLDRPGVTLILRRMWDEEFDMPLTIPEIIDAVAEAFHRPPYTPSGAALINFKVHLQVNLYLRRNL